MYWAKNRHESAARRFLNLIDELYDRNVQFIFSTTIALENLYQGQKLKFEFQRALSRLNEMQGDDYQQVRLAMERASGRHVFISRVTPHKPCGLRATPVPWQSLNY